MDDPDLLGRLFDSIHKEDYSVHTPKNWRIGMMFRIALAVSDDICQMEWTILRAPEATSFVTSDNPFVVISPNGMTPSWPYTNEADNICAELRESQNYSFDHRNCLHGLGHGSMYVLENELFEALRTCDSLTEEWEKDQCSGGVFMENVMAHDNPGHPSKYLKADRPFYPCTEVKTEYKTQCYARHTEYALKVADQHDTTVQDNFAKVFDLCAKVEEGFRVACYSGLGHQTATEESLANITDEARAAFTRELCMLGQDYEALYYCVVAAARQLVFYYDSDAQAKALCESLTSADLRAVCLQRTEEQLAKQRYAQEASTLYGTLHLATRGG